MEKPVDYSKKSTGRVVLRTPLRVCILLHSIRTPNDKVGSGTAKAGRLLPVQWLGRARRRKR